MNLEKKKILASKVLGVGKKRIIFIEPRLSEIKEAITRQDIRDLHKDGAIVIRNIKGKKARIKIKSRSVGNVRKKMRKKKKNYMSLVRKQRKYVAELKSTGRLSREEADLLMKRIRNSYFKIRNHLKKYIQEMKK